MGAFGVEMIVAAALVPALGAPIGAYIAKLTKDEIINGKTILGVLGHMMVAALLFLVLLKFLPAITAAVIAFIAGAALSLLDIKKNAAITPPWAMVIVAFAIFLLLESSYLPVAAAIAFTYLLVMGSLSEGFAQSLTYSAYYLVSFVVFVLFVQF